MSAKQWELDYDVTADFRPFRHWCVKAEGESDARLKVSRLTGIPVEELAATITGKEVQA